MLRWYSRCPWFSLVLAVCGNGNAGACDLVKYMCVCVQVYSSIRLRLRLIVM